MSWRIGLKSKLLKKERKKESEWWLEKQRDSSAGRAERLFLL